MNLVLAPGESVDVTLADTDGKFTISYGKESLTVFSYLPDQHGRVGVIYKETCGIGYPVGGFVEAVTANKAILSVSHQAKLYSILKEYANLEFNNTVNRDTTSIDLGFDSLDVTDVLLTIEDAFDVPFPSNYEWSTVGQIEDYLAANLAKI